MPKKKPLIRVGGDATREARVRARMLAPEAIDALRDIMIHGKSETCRVRAAIALLDRALGTCMPDKGTAAEQRTAISKADRHDRIQLLQHALAEERRKHAEEVRDYRDASAATSSDTIQ